MKTLNKHQAEAIGWAWSFACNLADEGVDIRKQEFPIMADQAKEEIGQPEIPEPFKHRERSKEENREWLRGKVLECETAEELAQVLTGCSTASLVECLGFLDAVPWLSIRREQEKYPNIVKWCLTAEGLSLADIRPIPNFGLPVGPPTPTPAILQLQYEELIQDRDRLLKWQEEAFKLHPNIDLDMPEILEPIPPLPEIDENDIGQIDGKD